MKKRHSKTEAQLEKRSRRTAQVRKTELTGSRLCKLEAGFEGSWQYPRKRWPRALLTPQESHVTPLRKSSPHSSGRVGTSQSVRRTSLLGDSRLPGGWTAQLVSFLGGTSEAVFLASAGKRTAAWLLRDAAQAAAELQPNTEALARATVWGPGEEAALNRVQPFGGILDALMPLSEPGSPLAGVATGSCDAATGHGGRARGSYPGRAAVASAANAATSALETARVRRIDKLLQGLAQRVRSLSGRLATPDVDDPPHMQGALAPAESVGLGVGGRAPPREGDLGTPELWRSWRPESSSARRPPAQRADPLGLLMS